MAPRGYSTIPTFKAALVARLQADTNIAAAAVSVTYGDPYPTPIADEWIWVGSSQSTGETAAAIGQQSREERYNLDLTIGKRDDSRALQKTVTERAFLLAQYVEQSLRSWGQGASAADPFSFSTTGVRYAGVIAAEHAENVTDAKRFAVVHLTLAVQARI